MENYIFDKSQKGKSLKTGTNYNSDNLDTEVGEIIITDGVGKGRTEKSAFDSALWQAGIANYNLLELSSVLPDNSDIVIQRRKIREGFEHGYRMYAVLSHAIAIKRGESAYAGIGWIQDKNTKGGLFVEHHGKSDDEVKGLIIDSLEDMRGYRTGNYGNIEYKIAGIRCEEIPACALVAAVFKVEGWE